eukprot:SAG31_NODE_1750_length_7353_cov_17.309209_9_plen_158_part_00
MTAASAHRASSSSLLKFASASRASCSSLSASISAIIAASSCFRQFLSRTILCGCVGCGSLIACFNTNLYDSMVAASAEAHSSSSSRLSYACWLSPHVFRVAFITARLHSCLACSAHRRSFRIRNFALDKISGQGQAQAHLQLWRRAPQLCVRSRLAL